MKDALKFWPSLFISKSNEQDFRDKLISGFVRDCQDKISVMIPASIVLIIKDKYGLRVSRDYYAKQKIKCDIVRQNLKFPDPSFDAFMDELTN